MLYKFSDCVSLDGCHDLSEKSVMYNAELSDCYFPDEETKIDAYMYVTGVLVEKIRENGSGGINDYLAMPLLNLYYNVLEASLKFMLFNLLCFSADINASSIETDKYYKLLQTHNLSCVIDAIRNYLKIYSQLSFPEFEDIANFVNELLDFGITSESTRYYRKKNLSEVPILYSKQSYVKVGALHESITFVTEKITLFIHNLNKV